MSVQLVFIFFVKYWKIFLKKIVLHFVEICNKVIIKYFTTTPELRRYTTL